jgi:hypothetical protein
MDIDNPVIVVGTGRCGSTLLHRLLALHPELGWLSTYNEVFPDQWWLSRFSGLYRLPGLGERIRHLRFFPKAFEAYRFWDYYLSEFSRRERPLNEQDVPPGGVEPVRRAVSAILAHQGRDRMLIKVTGWSRMGYFVRLFPKARFIWLNREHRAVVSSWVQAGWLDVTSSPDSENWQWGPVPDAYMAIWRELGGGPLLSAALKIQLDLDDIRANSARLPGRTLKVEYEALITHPTEVMRQICDFTGLSWGDDYAQFIASHRFYDPQNKWRKYLTDEQGEIVLDFFRRADQVSPVQQEQDGPALQPAAAR